MGCRRPNRTSDCQENRRDLSTMGVDREFLPVRNNCFLIKCGKIVMTASKAGAVSFASPVAVITSPVAMTHVATH